MLDRLVIAPHTSANLRHYDPDGVQQLNTNHQLLEILPLKADQLTTYLEEAILDNPFIEITYPTASQSNQPISPEDPTMEENLIQASLPISLTTYLLEQIMLYRHTEIRDMMVRLVDLLDDQGYLPYTYQELAQQFEADEMVVLDAITLLQQLEPTGVGASDLRTCLMLQTEQDDQAPNSAYYLLENGFDLISQGAYDQLMTEFDLSDTEVAACLNYYKSLRPNPAAVFDHMQSDYMTADIVIKASDNQVVCYYQSQYLPVIKFNESYYADMVATQDEEVLSFIAPMRAHYEQLQLSLSLRQELVSLVTGALVREQYAFFAHTGIRLKQLSMKEIAKITGLSEALVYLSLANKTLEFDRRISPLTDFIVAGQREAYKDNQTPLDLKTVIHELIHHHPGLLSNQEIKQLLKAQAIYLSEQQVAAYRDQIGH